MEKNYYHSLLGVPSDINSPTPHQLLGLDADCRDAALINQAARRQLKKLDRYRLSPEHELVDASQALMNEIAQARNALLADIRVKPVNQPSNSKASKSQNTSSHRQSKPLAQQRPPAAPAERKAKAPSPINTDQQHRSTSPPTIQLTPAARQILMKTIIGTGIAATVIVLAGITTTATLYMGMKRDGVEQPIDDSTVVTPLDNKNNSQSTTDSISPPNSELSTEATQAKAIQAIWANVLAQIKNKDEKSSKATIEAFLLKYPEHEEAQTLKASLDSRLKQQELWSLYHQNHETKPQIAVDALVQLMEKYPKDVLAVTHWQTLRLLVPESESERQQRQKHLKLIEQMHTEKRLTTKDFQRARSLLQKDPRQLNERDQALARATWYLAENRWDTKAYLSSVTNIEAKYKNNSPTKKKPTQPETATPVAHADLLKVAKDHRKKKQWAQARATLDKIIALDPTHREAWIAYQDVIKQSQKRDTIKNSIGMKLNKLPAGRFLMGSPEDEEGRDADETQRPVTLTKDVYMSQNEITIKDWHAVMHPGERMPGTTRNVGIIDSRSMGYVTWDEAKEFCRRLSQIEGRLYRLPTEAEWEYASRAGSLGAWIPTKSYNIHISGVFAGPFAYGTLGPNAGTGGVINTWGFRNLHGSTWEWVEDDYDPYQSGPATDPLVKNNGSRKVIRGGAYNSNMTQCRVANRGQAERQISKLMIGFRVVLEPEVTVTTEALSPTKSDTLKTMVAQSEEPRPDQFIIPEAMKPYVLKADQSGIVLRKRPDFMQVSSSSKIQIVINKELLIFDVRSMKAWLLNVERPSAAYSRFEMHYNHGYVWWASNGSSTQKDAPYLGHDFKQKLKLESPYAVSTPHRYMATYANQSYTHYEGRKKRIVRSDAIGTPTGIMDVQMSHIVQIYKTDAEYRAYWVYTKDKMGESLKISASSIPTSWTISKIMIASPYGGDSRRLFILAKNPSGKSYLFSLNPISKETTLIGEADDFYFLRYGGAIAYTKANQVTLITSNHRAVRYATSYTMPRQLPVSYQVGMVNSIKVGPRQFEEYIIMGSAQADQNGHYHISIQPMDPSKKTSSAPTRSDHSDTTEQPNKASAQSIPKKMTTHVAKFTPLGFDLHVEPKRIATAADGSIYVLTETGIIHYDHQTKSMKLLELPEILVEAPDLLVNEEQQLMYYQDGYDEPALYVYKNGEPQLIMQDIPFIMSADGKQTLVYSNRALTFKNLAGKTLLKPYSNQLIEGLPDAACIGNYAVMPFYHHSPDADLLLVNFARGTQQTLKMPAYAGQVYSTTRYDLIHSSKTRYLIIRLRAPRESGKNGFFVYRMNLSRKTLQRFTETGYYKVINKGQAIAFKDKGIVIYSASSLSKGQRYNMKNGSPSISLVQQSKTHTIMASYYKNSDGHYAVEFHPHK